MKKIFLLMGLAAGLTFTSCSDFLDKEPSTELKDDEAITTVNDLQNAVNGVAYRLIDYDNGTRMTYNSEFGLYADVLTNDFKIAKDNGQISDISQYTMTANSNHPHEAYYYFYGDLGHINKTLSYIPQVSGDETTINNLKGQLLAWRGLLHFDLARMFAHIPSTVADVNAANSGIVLSDQVFASDYKGKRATLQETYDFIIKDLTDAMGLLSKEKTLGAFNYYGAEALRARAYLYMGEYQKALTDAKDVIDNGGYELYTRANYVTAWSQEGTSESIFEIRVNDTHNCDRYSTGYYLDASGYAECAFNTESRLFQYLQSNTNDVRHNLIKDQSKAESGKGYFSAKYPGRGSSIYVNNARVIRLSEMYLIAAEASYYLYGGAAAAPYINAIEENRVANYQDVSSVTLDDILFEYEKEFFTENQIAFAYWRNKRSITNQVKNIINYDDDRTIMPIPQHEIDYCGKDILVQNPGY